MRIITLRTHKTDIVKVKNVQAFVCNHAQCDRECSLCMFNSKLRLNNTQKQVLLKIFKEMI